MKDTKRTNYDYAYDPLGDEVAFAYSRTTAQQRLMVAEDFDKGKKDTCGEYAGLLQIDRDGLMIASLLEAEHPSICAPSGRPLSIKFGELLDMFMAYTKPVDKSGEPVDNPLFSVDNSPITVDETVDNPVDKKPTYPQKDTYPQNSPFLSTECIFIPNLSTRACG